MQKQVTCVIGCSYGDEGKGKIVDVLAKNFDFVVRYQGGDNAGHTIKFNDKVYKLSLIPTGIFNTNTKVVLTHGVVINPDTLISEIEYVKTSGFETYKRLFVSQNAHIIFEFHQIYDALIESKNNIDAIGTTKKGIGYAYCDKMRRIGLQIRDLLDLQKTKIKLQKLLEFYNTIFLQNNLEPIKLEEVMKKMQLWAQKLSDYIVDTNFLLRKAINRKQNILLEGAQGILLDIDYGNYPFVTSSSVANFYTNSGLSYRDIKEVIGVVKAYSTRVGNGLFPTELEDQNLANLIRKKADEYGSVTGRPRRIGWLDLVTLKHAVQICGITSIAVSLVDILSGIKRIKVCVDYEYPKQGLKQIFDSKNQPIYVEFPGWDEDISNVQTWDELPTATKMYLSFIRDYLKVKITYISVGKERKQIIVV